MNEKTKNQKSAEDSETVEVDKVVIKPNDDDYKRKWYHPYKFCSSCFARNDKHDMNCVECCPVKNGDKPNELYKVL